MNPTTQDVDTIGKGPVVGQPADKVSEEKLKQDKPRKAAASNKSMIANFFSLVTALATTILAVVTIFYVIDTHRLVKTAQDQAKTAQDQVEVAKGQTERLIQQVNIGHKQLEIIQRQLDLSIDPLVGINDDRDIVGNNGIFPLEIHNFGIVDVSQLKLYARSLAFVVPEKGEQGFFKPLTFNDEPIGSVKFVGKGKKVRLYAQLGDHFHALDEVVDKGEGDHVLHNVYPGVEFTLKYHRVTDGRVFTKTLKFPCASDVPGNLMTPLSRICMSQSWMFEDMKDTTHIEFLGFAQRLLNSQRDSYSRHFIEPTSAGGTINLSPTTKHNKSTTEAKEPSPPTLQIISQGSHLMSQVVPTTEFIETTNSALDCVDELEVLVSDANHNSVDLDRLIKRLSAVLKKYERYYDPRGWPDGEQKQVYANLRTVLQLFKSYAFLRSSGREDPQAIDPGQIRQHARDARYSFSKYKNKKFKIGDLTVQ